MQIQLNEMSLGQLVAVYNAIGADLAIDGFKPVKTVPSKSKGVEKIEALIEDRFVIFEVDEDGAVTYAVDEAGGEDAVDETAEAVPFVKATKEELSAMDAATRADYRKRRRAAARSARKSAAA